MIIIVILKFNMLSISYFSHYSCVPGEQPLATVESYIQDATALLSTITQPSLDILPKYQEAITLLSQAENLLAAAHSLKTKLIQGLEISGEKVKKYNK